MILLHTKNIILAGFTLGFLAACSSTTTTGTDPGGLGPCPIEGWVRGEDTVCYDPTITPTSRNGVTTGTISTTNSSNGLLFADFGLKENISFGPFYLEPLVTENVPLYI